MKRRITSYKPLVIASIYLVLGLCATFYLAYDARRENAARVDTILQSLGREMARDVQVRIHLYQYGLRGVRGLVLTAGRELNHELFNRYMLSRDIETEFPGARGFGFARRVPQAEEAAYIASMREKSYPEFSVHQFEPHDGERFVIEYLEPIYLNQEALGLDIASEPMRRMAALESLHSGEIRLVGPIQLVQEGRGARQTYAILMPVYRGAVTPPTVREREAKGVGWALAPLVMDEVMSASGFLDNSRVELVLSDVTDPENPVTVFQSGSSSGLAAMPQTEVTREVFGRQWQFQVLATPQLLALLNLTSPNTIIAIGLMVSLLVFLALLGWGYGNIFRRQIVEINKKLESLVKTRTRELEGSRSTLQGILDNLPSHIAYWDRDLHLIMANRACLANFGDCMEGRDLEQAVGLAMRELLSEESYRTLKPYFDRVVASGERFVEELHATSPLNGEAMDLQIHVVPEKRGDSITGFYSLVHDITEFHQNSRKLDALVRENQALLEAASEVAIVATDTEGTITVFNSGAANMLGYSADEMVGKQAPTVFHRMEEVVSRSRQLSEHFGEPIRGFEVFVYLPRLKGSEIRQWTLVRKDGSEVRVSLAVTAMHDARGTITGYLTVAVDITAEEHSREQLEVARNQLAIAADVAKLGVWSWDYSSSSLQWNERMFEIYGLPQPPAGENPSHRQWRESVYPEDIALIDNQIQAALAGEGANDVVFRIRVPGGETRSIQAAAQVERDSQGRPTRVTGINRDITPQLRFEDELRQAKELADSANAAKSAFLANMSHEIRTPISAVLGMLKLVQGTGLDPRQRDYIRKADTAARILLELLNDILDFSKIEAGKLELENCPVDLEQFMQDLGIVLVAYRDEKPVELSFAIDPALPPRVLGDPLRLKQILINLAGNALKFTEQGQVVIRLEQVARRGDQLTLRVAVTDTGIGISEEQQKNIFDYFSQAETLISRQYGGTGLGLVICKRLVEVMGGELKLESEVGKGSRFWFEVDLAVADEPATARVVADASMSARVLLVEEKPAVAEIIESMLSGMGYQVDTVHTGSAAIGRVQTAAVSDRHYDVVLMNWHLPDINGDEAAKFITNSNIQPASPKVILLAAHGKEFIQHGPAARSEYYCGLLTKPVTPWQLQAAITAAINGEPVITTEEVDKPVRGDRLRGLHLLVVEDNAINRQVAEELLTGEGARVELACNGREGLEKVTRAGQIYDVVIMDMQMPGIDGLEATRQIRADARFRDLPILAMTANASKADREACLDAGMNEHIGKPVDLEQAVSVILSLLGRNNEKVLEEKESEKQLEQVVLKRFGGDVEMFARIQRGFYPTINGLLNDLGEAIRHRDRQAAQFILHSIKGTAGSLGAVQLSACAAELEQAVKRTSGGDWAGWIDEEQLARLRGLFESIAPQLDALAGILPLPPAAPPVAQSLSEAELTVQLEALLELLEANNMRALDMVEVIREAVPPSYIAPLQTLVAQVNALEFGEAATTLKTVLQEVQ